MLYQPAINQLTNLSVFGNKVQPSWPFESLSLCLCTPTWMCMLIRVMYVYLCICLSLFCICVGCSSAKCFFSSIILLSAERWVWQYASFSLLLLLWQMYFYLAVNLELAFCLVWLVSLLSLTSSWHTKMPKAITVKYQHSLLDGSRNVALMDAVLQWEAPGIGSRAYPAWPTPHHQQTDGLMMEDGEDGGSLPVMLCYVRDICPLS